MAPANILITGCNRGIGLELAKEYLRQTPKNLFVTCRDSAKAKDLKELAGGNINLHVLQLEVTDHGAYPKIRETVRGSLI